MIAAMSRCWPLLLVLAACPRDAARPPPPISPSNEVPEIAGQPELRAVIAEARAAHDGGDDVACVEALGEIDAAWLGVAATDQEALDVARACVGRDEELCDYYLDDDAYCTLRLEIALAPRRAYADATSPPCGFGAHDLAIAIPGDPDHCIAIEPGTGIEIDDLPEDGSTPPGVCPRLVVLRHVGDGARVIEQAREGSSFLDEVSDCCHAAVLAIRGNAGAFEVILSSDGPYRDCFGGTASVDEFEVYRFDGSGFVPVDSHSVLMH